MHRCPCEAMRSDSGSASLQVPTEGTRTPFPAKRARFCLVRTICRELKTKFDNKVENWRAPLWHLPPRGPSCGCPSFKGASRPFVGLLGEPLSAGAVLGGRRPLAIDEPIHRRHPEQQRPAVGCLDLRGQPLERYRCQSLQKDLYAADQHASGASCQTWSGLDDRAHACDFEVGNALGLRHPTPLGQSGTHFGQDGPSLYGVEAAQL